MKIINSKNTGLFVLTAVLSMSLTHAIANDVGTSRKDSPSPFGAEQKPDSGKDHDMSRDSTITNEVHSGFSSNEDFRDTTIDVKTENGEVSLSGEVSTEAQRDMAISKAKAIQGVKRVNSDELKIRD